VERGGSHLSSESSDRCADGVKAGLLIGHSGRLGTVSSDGQVRRASRGDDVCRAICAAICVATGVYAAFAGLIGLVALLGLDDTAHPTEARTYPLGALACLVSAVWAGRLAYRRPPRGWTLGVGSVAGVVLAAMTFYLWGGGAPPQPPRTTIGLVFAGVQVAAVPILALLLRRPRLRCPAAAVLGIGVLLLGAGTTIYASGTRQVEERQTVGHQITAVTISSGIGDITIHGDGAPGSMEVIRRARLGAWRDLPPIVLEDSDQPSLGGNQNSVFDSDVSYEVRVPAGVRVSAQTFSGNVVADGEFSSVRLQGGSGYVRADLSPTFVDAYTTMGGSINLRLRTAPTALALSSDSGRVDVGLPADATYAIETPRAVPGAVVTVLQDSASTHRVTVTVGAGGLSLHPN